MSKKGYTGAGSIAGGNPAGSQNKESTGGGAPGGTKTSVSKQ